MYNNGMAGLLGNKSAFAEAIYDIVRQIPEGYVATYGQVARLAGYPGAARAAGTALSHCMDPRTPCFRVVSAQGKLSSSFGPRGVAEHRRQLEEDGIEVINYRVDLTEFQWKV